MLTQHKAQLDARDANPALVQAAGNPYAVSAILQPQLQPRGPESRESSPMSLVELHNLVHLSRFALFLPVSDIRLVEAISDPFRYS